MKTAEQIGRELALEAARLADAAALLLGERGVRDQELLGATETLREAARP